MDLMAFFASDCGRLEVFISMFTVCHEKGEMSGWLFEPSENKMRRGPCYGSVWYVNPGKKSQVVKLCKEVRGDLSKLVSQVSAGDKQCCYVCASGSRRRLSNKQIERSILLK